MRRTDAALVLDTPVCVMRWTLAPREKINAVPSTLFLQLPKSNLMVCLDCTR